MAYCTFGMDSGDSLKDQHSSGEDDRRDGVSEPKSFVLLNDLSDLLMLPKDTLMDRSTRQEVCPSIGLALVKRVLCNFTPDEFCPDPFPGAVLEALNAESIVERRISEDSGRSFPYSAGPVVNDPPSLSDVAEKVAVTGGKAPLVRNVCVLQRKGYYWKWNHKLFSRFPACTSPDYTPDFQLVLILFSKILASNLY